MSRLLVVHLKCKDSYTVMLIGFVIILHWIVFEKLVGGGKCSRYLRGRSDFPVIGYIGLWVDWAQ